MLFEKGSGDEPHVTSQGEYMFMRYVTSLLSALVCAVSAVSLSHPALGANPVRLVMAHGTAPGNPRTEASNQFAEIVREESQGRIVVEVGGDAVRGDNLEILSALRANRLDLGIVTHGTLSSIVPELAVLGLPYAFRTPEKAWELLDADIGKDLARKIERENLIVMGWMDNGVRQIMSNSRPIVRSDDMLGLRIRTSSDNASLDTMRALGAVPIPIPFSNVYEALKHKYVDAQDNTLANFYTAKLHEQQKYLSITNHCYGFALFLMNRKAWDSLSAEQQSLVKTAADKATLLQREMLATMNDRIRAEYERNPSIKIVPADENSLKRATKDIWDRWEVKPFGAFVKRLRQASE